jgi:hypothetical protein
MTAKHQIEVSVHDGKYTVILDSKDKFYALRHNMKWRSLTGDSLILSLAQEIETLKDRIKTLEKNKCQ